MIHRTILKQIQFIKKKTMILTLVTSLAFYLLDSGKPPDNEHSDSLFSTIYSVETDSE